MGATQRFPLAFECQKGTENNRCAPSASRKTIGKTNGQKTSGVFKKTIGRNPLVFNERHPSVCLRGQSYPKLQMNAKKHLANLRKGSSLVADTWIVANPRHLQPPLKKLGGETLHLDFNHVQRCG